MKTIKQVQNTNSRVFTEHICAHTHKHKRDLLGHQNHIGVFPGSRDDVGVALSHQVSYLVVDEMHQEHPDLIRDQYWDETEFELPYTLASEQSRETAPHMGSAADIQ